MCIGNSKFEIYKVEATEPAIKNCNQTDQDK